MATEAEHDTTETEESGADFLEVSGDSLLAVLLFAHDVIQNDAAWAALMATPGAAEQLSALGKTAEESRERMHSLIDVHLNVAMARDMAATIAAGTTPSGLNDLLSSGLGPVMVMRPAPVPAGDAEAVPEDQLHTGQYL